MTSKRPNLLAGRAVDPLDARAARSVALDALGRRDYASEDLRRKLLEKGYDPTIVAEVIEGLSARRLLDDRRYVDNFIGFRAARGHGPVRVRADLCEIGVPLELVDEGLRSYGDWVDQMLKARRKRFGEVLPADDAEKRRQAGFLKVRGFTGEQIRLALDLETDIDVDM